MAKKFENLTRTAIIEVMLNPWPFIRVQIQHHSWSSKQVAEMADVSASGVRALMNGQNKRPSAEMQQKLLKLCVDEYTDKPIGNAYLKAPIKKTAPKKKVSKKKVAKKKAAKKSSSGKTAGRNTGKGSTGKGKSSTPDWLK